MFRRKSTIGAREAPEAKTDAGASDSPLSLLSGGAGFTNREVAVGFWLVVALVWALARKDVRSSMSGVLRAFLHPKVGGVALLGACYMTLVVLGLRSAGFWDTAMVKDSVYWFVGTAIVSLPRIVGKGVGFLRALVDDGLKVAVGIEFLANLYSFPIYIEVFLVPVVFFAIALQVVASMNAEHAAVEKLMGRLLVGLGLIVLFFSVHHAIVDRQSVLTRETAFDFALPLVLTIAWVPFLYTFGLAAAYEQAFMRVEFALRHSHPEIIRRTKLGCIRACRVDLDRVNLFLSDVAPKMFAADSAEDVDRLLSQFRRRPRRAA